MAALHKLIQMIKAQILESRGETDGLCRFVDRRHSRLVDPLWRPANSTEGAVDSLGQIQQKWLDRRAVVFSFSGFL